jgi:tetratricopeptide (TPR) repeat protein
MDGKAWMSNSRKELAIMKSAMPKILVAAAGLAALLLRPEAVVAQGTNRTPRADSLRQAIQLDRHGQHAAARAILMRLIETAPDAEAKAQAQRRMAMSYGFEGDCASAVKYQEQVIAYWKTREQDDPQNAFYQQGEMANEVARVCLDAGDLESAERMYRLGYELGTREPEPRTHPKSLWDYRLAHALGRIAARRGDVEEARRQVAEARRILDSDPAMAKDQERFFPYLAGYVALYTGDLKGAEEQLIQALQTPGNEQDPFMHCLLAMTYEQMGERDKARELYQKAYDLATAHNPPSAFARRFARQKLAAQGSR